MQGCLIWWSWFHPLEIIFIAMENIVQNCSNVSNYIIDAHPDLDSSDWLTPRDEMIGSDIPVPSKSSTNKSRLLSKPRSSLDKNFWRLEIFIPFHCNRPHFGQGWLTVCKVYESWPDREFVSNVCSDMQRVGRLLTRTSAARCTQKAHYWSPHPRETQIVVAAAPKEENAQMIFVYLKCPSLDWIHLKWDKATESSLIQRLTWRPTVPVMVQIIRTVLTRHQTREKILYAWMCVCVYEREAENVLVS